MNIATPYPLPFAMSGPAAGALALDEDFDLRVGFTRPPDLAAAEVLFGVVTAFCVLAGTGAMSGSGLAASNSRVRDLGPAGFEGTVISFGLAGVRLDDRALVILAHLLLSEWEPLKFARVELQRRSEPTALRSLVHDSDALHPYPGLDPSIGFAVRMPPAVIENADVAVRFVSVLDDEQRQTVQTQLQTWAATAVGGAYALAPNPPIKSMFVAERCVEWVDEDLGWGLSTVRVHPGAFHGLVNAVAALDQRGLSVQQFSVE